jgi:hypothetical protein
MKIARFVIAVTAVAIMAGCAHPITINPDIAKIERDAGAQPVDKNVGYYISAENREKQVTTPGGGGDKVSYSPYKDIEATYFKMLSNVFKSVTMLKAPNDANEVSGRRIDYIVDLDLVTDSSSPSPFTWPPTKFTVNMTCKISKPQGQSLMTASVVGEGAAEFGEFKKDFSLSARRASQDALLKMQRKLLNAPELRK